MGASYLVCSVRSTSDIFMRCMQVNVDYWRVLDTFARRFIWSDSFTSSRAVVTRWRCIISGLFIYYFFVVSEASKTKAHDVYCQIGRYTCTAVGLGRIQNRGEVYISWTFWNIKAQGDLAFPVSTFSSILLFPFILPHFCTSLVCLWFQLLS